MDVRKKAICGLVLWALSPSSRAEVAIRGRVLAPPAEGSPEIAVELLAMDSERPVARTTPDVKGFFELAAPGDGWWKVAVEAPACPAMELALAPLVEPLSLPTLKLERAAAVEMRVTGPEGRPQDAAVELFYAGDDSGRGWRAGPVRATAEHGTARMSKDARTPAYVQVLADGLAPHLTVLETGEHLLEVRLEAGIQRTFEVRDAAGRPVPAARIHLDRGAPPIARSDEEGRFQLTIARPLPVDVLGPGGDCGRFELAAEGPATLDLLPPRWVDGRVVDFVTRDPVASAWVWVSRHLTAESDAHGRFTLAVPVLADGGLEVVAAGYGRIRELALAETLRPAELVVSLPAAAQVRGRVVDGDGRPLVDVAIFADPPRLDPLLAPAGVEVGRSWRALSDRDGTFVVPGLVARASHRLVFSKSGFVSQHRAVEALAAFETRSLEEVILRPGRLGVGWVIDGEERPIAGARVRLRASPAGGGPQLLRHLQPPVDEHLSDADGRFVITDLGGGRYDLEVEAEGFGATVVPGLEVSESRQPAVDLGTVVLLRSVAFEGRVRDPDGEVLAGAAIEVVRRPFGGSVPPAPRALSSDGDGRFTIRDLRRGERPVLHVARPGYLPRTVTGVASPTARPFEVVLHRAAAIAGLAVDPFGEPVAGVTVWAGSTPAEPPDGVETGDDGRFLLSGVEVGTVSVYARSVSHRTAVLSGIETAAGETVDGLELVLDPGASLAGRVRDARGEPVFGAWVTAGRHRSATVEAPRVARSDADGRYRIDGLPPGPVRVAARRAQYPGVGEIVDLRPGDNTADLTLPSGVTLSGRVSRAAGEAVAGADVTVESAPGSSGTSQVLDLGSAADGSFEVLDVPPGRYLLSAHKEGLAGSPAVAVEVGDQPVRGIELELVEGASLSGRVLGVGLDELAVLELLAWPSEGGPASMRRGQVGHTGDYRFDHLRPGVWNVQARLPDTGRAALERVVLEDLGEEARRDLDLGHGFTLRGTLTDRGRPLSGARIFVRRHDGSSAQVASDALGEFRVDHLEAGGYTLLVAHGGVRLHSESLELARDRELRVDLDTSTVAGRVTDASGQPLAAAHLTFERLDGEPDPWAARFLATGRAATDAAGRFVLGHLPAGAYLLSAAMPGYLPAEVQLDVAASRILDDLVLSPARPSSDPATVLEPPTTTFER